MRYLEWPDRREILIQKLPSFFEQYKAAGRMKSRKTCKKGTNSSLYGNYIYLDYSESTLRLFDLWLEMDAHGIGESDSDEDDTALFRRASAFGEEGGEEEYSFEIQDSSSSDEDMTLNIDADDDEDDDDEEDDDEGDGLDSGEGWKLFKTDEGQYIVEMQDSDGETFYVDVGDIAETSGEEEEEGEGVQEKKSKPRKRERGSNNNNRREKKRNRKPPKGTKEKPEKKKRKKLRK